MRTKDNGYIKRAEDLYAVLSCPYSSQRTINKYTNAHSHIIN